MIYLSLVLICIAISGMIYLFWLPALNEEGAGRWYDLFVLPFKGYSRFFMTWSYRFKIDNLLGITQYQSYNSVEQFVLYQTMGLFFGVISGVFLALYLQCAITSLCCLAIFIGVIGFYVPLIRLKDQVKRGLSEVERHFPFFLDMLTLSLESGLGFQSALKQSVDMFPDNGLKDALTQLESTLQVGVSKQEAFQKLMKRLPLSCVQKWSQTVLHADRTGMSLGRVMRSLSLQSRDKRFEIAEKKAMKIPIKMMFPLVLFFFPCTFVILLFPVVMKILSSGAL